MNELKESHLRDKANGWLVAEQLTVEYKQQVSVAGCAAVVLNGVTAACVCRARRRQSASKR